MACIKKFIECHFLIIQFNPRIIIKRGYINKTEMGRECRKTWEMAGKDRKNRPTKAKITNNIKLVITMTITKIKISLRIILLKVCFTFTVAVKIH